MNIEFSTTDPVTAREYLRKAVRKFFLPSMTEERISRFVKAVADGLIRVGDPAMYPNGIPITPTEKGEAMREELTKMLS